MAPSRRAGRAACAAAAQARAAKRGEGQARVGAGRMNPNGMGGGQVFVLNQTQKRESGRKAQLGNVQAARAVSDIIRTTL